MSSTAITLRRPAAVTTPAWTLLSMLGMGAAVYAAVSAGGTWPLTFSVLLVIGAAFLLVLRHPHLGIVVFLTTFLINYPGVARGAGALTINNVLGMVFLGLLSWDYYLHRDAWYLRDPLIRALMVVGVIFAVGTVAAEYTLPDEYVQGVIKKHVGAKYFKTDYTSRFIFQYFSRLAFAIFIVQFVRTPRQLWWVFVALLGCILAAVPPSIASYVSTRGEDVRALTKIVNWADNANRFAFGCLLGIGICYYLGATARAWWAKGAAALGAVLLLPLVLLSASRSGFLGMFLLGFLVLRGAFGMHEGRASRAASLWVVLGLAAVAVLTYVFVLSAAMQERILNLNPFAEGQLEGSKSTEFRTATLVNSIDIISRHPVLGVGLGNFRWVHKYLHGRYKPPHNSYVWALAEGGVPLLLAYVALFVLLWRRLTRLMEPYAHHPVLPFFAHWLRVYLVLFLFFSMFADIWIEEHLFLLAGAAMLLDRWRSAAAEAGGATAPPPGGAPSAFGRGPRPAGGRVANRRGIA